MYCCLFQVQEDHSMWMESLLFHTLPAPVGQFLHNYTMPYIGEPLGDIFSYVQFFIRVHLQREICTETLHGCLKAFCYGMQGQW